MFTSCKVVGVIASAETGRVSLIRVQKVTLLTVAHSLFLLFLLRSWLELLCLPSRRSWTAPRASIRAYVRAKLVEGSLLVVLSDL